MASSADSSDSERKMKPAKNHGSSVKRVLSSSEEETAQEQRKTPSSGRNEIESESCVGSRRDSLRKRKKEFQLPSREEKWSAIHTDPKVTNQLSHLKPRRLINDFTRVTHRYNYDFEEVSGEESMDEFIKGTDSSESESSDSSTTQERNRSKKKGHRVKGYRPNIVIHSDESSDNEPPDSVHPQPAAEKHVRHQSEMKDTGQQENNQQSNKYQLRKREKSGKTVWRLKKESSPWCVQEKKSSEEDSEPVIATKHPRRRSALDSDSENSSQSSSSDDESLKWKSQTKSKSSGLQMDSAKATNPGLLSRENDSQDIITPSRKKARAKSTVLSDSDTEGNDSAHQNLSLDKQASVLPNNTCDTLKEVTLKSIQINSEASCKDLETESSVTINGSSSNSPITVDDSDESSSCDNSSVRDESSGDSSDGVECSRIAKLAAMKKQKRDNMLDFFKAARAKRQSNK